MKSNRFMGNLKITTKLFLGALSFSIPIAVLVFLTVSEINYDMSFGSLEKTGNAYLQSLQNLSQDLTYHQFLLSKKNPEDETQKKIREQQQAVNQRFEELRVVDKTLKKSLKLADSDLKITGTQEISYASLKALWEEIKSSIAKEQKVNALAKIQILKKNIYDAIKHVGDKSNLILDPDLDSYYLMDLTLITLPQAQKRLADLYIFTESLSDKAALSTEDKQELVVFLKLLQEADLDRVNVDVQTAIAEDANFYGVSETLQTRMPSLIDNYSNKYETLFTKIKKLKQNSTELLSNPSDQIVTIKTQEISELQKAILDAWKESYIFWDQSRVELDRLLDSRIDAFKFERLQALLLSAVAVALACFLMYLISRSIYRPLRTFTKLAQEITQDTDLSVSIPVTGKDQIGQLGEAFNSMISSMRRLVEQLSGTTFGLAETANSIKENAEFEVKGASDQSAAIAEISSAIEELATTADHIAKNSQTVSEVAEQTLESILQIQGQVNHTNSKILNLGEKSKSIGGIIKIIEDLSEQINLLALNAAIEAAHAGDAGKGFAVVASEVRKLSERSGESAQEVRALINEIQTETNSAVLGVEESSKQVNKGLEKVQETTQQAKEISVATKQQKIATEQVTLSMHNIDKVVRQMTDATEKTAETVSHLEQEAEKVRKVIEVFKLN